VIIAVLMVRMEATAFVCGHARPHQIGYGDRCNDQDDGNYNQQLNERESSLFLH
jgi:hypothetical protein